MSRRQQRLNAQFRQELALLIHSEVRDPRLPDFVTITEVDISADLTNATVRASVLGDEQAKLSAIEALTAATPFLRRHLYERIHIRRIPALHFILDESIEAAARLLAMMKEVPETESLQ
ncbi:MAG: 30S ribosome-binding factor RbfA [Dehalococcoidia bacterium]